jgi:hypothetical protein
VFEFRDGRWDETEFWHLVSTGVGSLLSLEVVADGLVVERPLSPDPGLAVRPLLARAARFVTRDLTAWRREASRSPGAPRVSLVRQLSSVIADGFQRAGEALILDTKMTVTTQMLFLETLG